MDYMYSAVRTSVVGALVLANEKEPITTDTSLLTPYLSPTLTFLPFWVRRGGGVSDGCVRWVSMDVGAGMCVGCCERSGIDIYIYIYIYMYI